ncbi:hypothetical protein [Streptomyces sp. SID13726]|uniref:hypothetical protein n=1 Tax=Streptomyces sp. SID13726 TaxID=2706058 RepID=UPI0013BB0572|nr:hypothetical protein [Streptomyces sp. SID13726]NEB00511.1 hypothetical protein [Streptomyces sp. SID13726]
MPVTGAGDPADGPEESGHVPPDVLPSTTDPDVECVRIGSREHTGGAALAAPPPGGAPEPPSDSPCPPGYVPRRRRTPHPTDGKHVLRPGPPERNPAPRPDADGGPPAR